MVSNLLAPNPLKPIAEIWYCEHCDGIVFPKELVKWQGKCTRCGRECSGLAVFEIEE